ncbi:hypothetical protein LCGC14_0464480 [marine sediment metagenome]|uniref:Uncharacterized protein n=1 Tax=marine sediment metagenome TaxID=412755 RepID=A0A0F9V0P5_9ZZZZ
MLLADNGRTVINRHIKILGVLMIILMSSTLSVGTHPPANERHTGIEDTSLFVNVGVNINSFSVYSSSNEDLFQSECLPIPIGSSPEEGKWYFKDWCYDNNTINWEVYYEKLSEQYPYWGVLTLEEFQKRYVDSEVNG